MFIQHSSCQNTFNCSRAQHCCSNCNHYWRNNIKSKLDYTSSQTSKVIENDNEKKRSLNQQLRNAKDRDNYKKVKLMEIKESSINIIHSREREVR